MTSQSRFDPEVLAILKPTDYLYRIYKDEEGNKVTIYFGYHDGGPDSGPIHSPKNCLPGSGWHRLSEEVRTMILKDREISLVSAIYQKDGTKELFLYWFQVRGKTITNMYGLKLAEITNSMFHNRKDTAFIRVSVRFDDDLNKALVLGEKFISDFYLEIDDVLPK